jgi:hypothetical protein
LVVERFSLARVEEHSTAGTQIFTCNGRKSSAV